MKQWFEKGLVMRNCYCIGLEWQFFYLLARGHCHFPHLNLDRKKSTGLLSTGGRFGLWQTKEKLEIKEKNLESKRAMEGLRWQLFTQPWLSAKICMHTGDARESNKNWKLGETCGFGMPEIAFLNTHTIWATESGSLTGLRYLSRSSPQICWQLTYAGMVNTH